MADFYVWLEKYKVPPSKPSGEIINSYLFKSDAVFYYYNDYLDTSILPTMADKGTGYHYSGLLEANISGKHTFELRFGSVQHFVNQFWSKDCRIIINIGKK